MLALPRAAQLFWLLVLAGSAFVALKVFSDARAQPFDWASAALFAFFGTVAGSFPIQLPQARYRQGETTSVAMAVNVAATIALPVPAAIAVVVIERLAYPLLVGSSAWYKRAFNLGQSLLSVAAAGTIWHTFGGPSGTVESPASVGWLLVALGAYFSINSGSVAVIVALVERAPVQYVWLRGHRRLLPSYLALMSTGVLGGILWSTYQPSVILVLIPLIAIYYSFKRTVELEEQTIAALFDLADMMDKRDYYTHRHSLRVGEYAERLATFLGLSADESQLLYISGRLHDIGKCAVDNEVLLKPGPLTEDERAHIMEHARVGGDMLAHFNMFKVVAAYVRGHHERWDGTGYPEGLAGGTIPSGARLLAVVDSYDAMTSTRPYRDALPHEEAVRRLREGAGSQWDARLVGAFLDMLSRQPAAAPGSAQAPARRREEEVLPVARA
ncbi:MAG TPA: HD-GYP domain-containing protein [Chloroflexota bacterium]|nr:HD-GYP domain-containing protein [Chloroflexota bacterium]